MPEEKVVLTIDAVREYLARFGYVVILMGDQDRAMAQAIAEAKNAEGERRKTSQWEAWTAMDVYPVAVNRGLQEMLEDCKKLDVLEGRKGKGQA